MDSPMCRCHMRSLRQYLMLCVAGLVITLPVMAQNTGFLEKLTGKVAEPVSPEEAFSVKVRRINGSRIVLDFAVRPGYYLYKERLSVALKDTPANRIAGVDYPPTVTKQDLTFGRSEVYTKPFALTMHLERDSKDAVSVVVKYQGCYEAMGVCYPPETKTVTLAAQR